MRTLYSAILLVASFASAYAQQQKASEEFPSRSIRIIIPFEPGGATDFLARPWAAKMSESLGQSVVVENKGGANTILGTGEVARAQPDGYTLLIMPPNFLTNPALTTTMPYKTPQDFESVGLLVKYPQVLVARKEFPANNISELIALAKKDPNKITLASSGAGTQAHLSGELLMQMAGINLVHVPFKGAGPAISSLAGGHVDLLFTAMSTAGPELESRNVKLLGTTSISRLPGLPNVQTIDEQGLSGFEAYVSYGVIAPAKTPRPIIDRLNKEISRAVNDPAVLKQLSTLGGDVRVSSADEMDKFLTSELTKWTALIQKAGIKPQ